MASANSTNLDILYAYDGLNRLTAYDRGDINSGHTAITTLAFAQDWDLDQLNYWSAFDEDDDGDATNELEPDRTHNDVNEITTITATTGPNWVDPTYDGAGNMITGPTPGAETSTQKYVYDAWNRLVKVTDGSDTTQATFGYDARNHRITKGVYLSGSLDHTRHYYHTEQNQVIEERIDSSTDPDRQYTWGNQYVDDLVVRTRDTDSNGSLDETVYALHDANWSVTALGDTSGAILERLRYDSFGRSAVLDADFSLDGDGTSDYEWEYRFTDREWDAESGLHYFRARYYDEVNGRFLQRDPIGYVDGLNLYAGYFLPQHVDPSGLKGPALGGGSGVRPGIRPPINRFPDRRNPDPPPSTRLPYNPGGPLYHPCDQPPLGIHPDLWDAVTRKPDEQWVIRDPKTGKRYLVKCYSGKCCREPLPDHPQDKPPSRPKPPRRFIPKNPDHCDFAYAWCLWGVEVGWNTWKPDYGKKNWWLDWIKDGGSARMCAECYAECKWTGTWPSNKCLPNEKWPGPEFETPDGTPPCWPKGWK